MLITKPVSRKAALLIQGFQAEKDQAQARLDHFVAGVLATLEVEGQVVSVDSENCVLNVEVAEEVKA